MKEASQRRTNTAQFHLYEGSKIVKHIAAESRRGVARSHGEEEVSSCCSVGIKVQL